MLLSMLSLFFVILVNFTDSMQLGVRAPNVYAIKNKKKAISR